MNNQHNIYLALLHKQQHFKNLSKDYLNQLKIALQINPVVFHNEIKSQCYKLIKDIIIDELTKKLAIPAEDVIVVLDSMNIEEYINL